MLFNVSTRWQGAINRHTRTSAVRRSHTARAEPAGHVINSLLLQQNANTFCHFFFIA